MTRKWMVLGAVFAVAAVWNGRAAAQRGELDVTMRVVDDVSGVDAVLIVLDDPVPAEGAVRDTGSAHDEAPALDAPGTASREETEEDVVEDRDLAEDLEEEPLDGAEE